MKKTYISIGQRVEKNFQNPHGWKRADFIPEDEICVLVLGGNGTNDDRRANGYAKFIDELLKAYDLKKNVKIYSLIYKNDTEGEDYFVPFLLQKRSREALMEKYGRTKKLVQTLNQAEYVRKAQALYGQDIVSDKNPEISNPEYIERLFEKTILYRISEEGKKLPLDEAKRRIRKLNIVAHCHGAYVFLKLEEMMQKKLQELGYSAKETAEIQKQLLCVAYAPYAPLGVSKSTMVSFASVQDSEVWHQNTFHQQIRLQNKDGQLDFSYFPDKLGDVFIVPSVIKENLEKTEHNFSNYISPNCELSAEGQKMLYFSRQAIINGVKSSIEEKPLINIENLICSENTSAKQVLKQALENGRKAYEAMVKRARIIAHWKDDIHS